MTKEEVLQHDKKFRYMLLSRVPNAVGLRVLSELWQQEPKTPVGWR